MYLTQIITELEKTGNTIRFTRASWGDGSPITITFDKKVGLVTDYVIKCESHPITDVSPEFANDFEFID
jgi:hypothetical protein